MTVEQAWQLACDARNNGTVLKVTAPQLAELKTMKHDQYGAYWEPAAGTFMGVKVEVTT